MGEQRQQQDLPETQIRRGGPYGGGVPPHFPTHHLNPLQLRISARAWGETNYCHFMNIDANVLPSLSSLSSSGGGRGTSAASAQQCGDSSNSILGATTDLMVLEKSINKL